MRDVVIVGGGQAGIAVAFALRCERVMGVEIIDRAAPGREGPWSTFARMPTLRTPKYLTGPDCGLPNLTFRAWFEAQSPRGAWERLERIPRLLWMDYLLWLRRVLGIEVRARTEVVGFGSSDDGFIEVRCIRDGAAEVVITRKLVFANGIDGGGSWTIPPSLASGLPPSVYAHSSEEIDFAALRGRAVAVLGIGAAALDNAAMALEAGAVRVDLFCRRPAIVAPDVRDWLERAGFLHGFGDLPDARKWSVMRRMLSGGAPPPKPSLDRCRAYANFALHTGAGWRSVSRTGSTVSIDTEKGVHRADFLIFGTGARTDLALRPEFAAHAAEIATWADRYVPPPGEGCARVSRYPYLGPGFQLTEKHPGTAPWFRDIHLFNWAATASLGVTGSSISGMRFGLARLIPTLVRDLYVSVADQHIAEMPWPDTARSAPE